MALLNDICFMENICQDKLYGKHLISNVWTKIPPNYYVMIDKPCTCFLLTSNVWMKIPPIYVLIDKAINVYFINMTYLISHVTYLYIQYIIVEGIWLLVDLKMFCHLSFGSSTILHFIFLLYQNEIFKPTTT